LLFFGTFNNYSRNMKIQCILLVLSVGVVASQRSLRGVEKLPQSDLSRRLKMGGKRMISVAEAGLVVESGGDMGGMGGGGGGMSKGGVIGGMSKGGVMGGMSKGGVMGGAVDDREVR
jgi:hypothetical protein